MQCHMWEWIMSIMFHFTFHYWQWQVKRFKKDFDFLKDFVWIVQSCNTTGKPNLILSSDLIHLQTLAIELLRLWRAFTINENALKIVLPIFVTFAEPRRCHCNKQNSFVSCDHRWSLVSATRLKNHLEREFV